MAPTEPPTSDGALADPSIPLSGDMPSFALPDSALLRSLGLPADGRPVEMPVLAAALAAAEPDGSWTSDPIAWLDTASAETGWTMPPPPDLRPSPDLATALAAYAHVTGKGSITDEEQALIARVPDVVARPLTVLVDALSRAQFLQAQATGDLSDEEKTFLLSVGPTLATGTASPEIEARAAALAERVDLGKSLAAARILLEAVDEVRPDLERAAASLLAAAEEGHDGMPGSTRAVLPSDPSREHVLRDTAALLRARAGNSRLPVPAATPLDAQLVEFAQVFGATPPPDALSRAQALPAPLSGAIGRIVAAYLQTLPLGAHAPSAAAGAAHVLEAIEASRPALEAWSWVLSVTPPLPAGDPLGAAVGLADDGSRVRNSPVDALRLTALQAGLSIETPQWFNEEAPPSPSVALDAWYEAFRPNTAASERARAAADLARMPQDVQRATVLLVWGQVQADQRARATLPSIQALASLDSARPAIAAVAAGRDPAPWMAQDLARHAALSRDVMSGLFWEPALIVVDAAERAQAMLSPQVAARHPETGTPVDEVEPVPDLPVPDPGVEPTEPTPPDTPRPDPPPGATDPRRDIWFADPTGTIVVTGFGTTRHSPGHIAVLLDLGGDDEYRNEAASAGPDLDRRYAVHIDMGGNDRYNTSRPFGQGAAQGRLLPTVGGELGLAPVGVLVDVAGDDVYRGGPFSQGAALGGGIALLADLGGADSYHVEGTWKQKLDIDVAGGQGYAVQGLDDERQTAIVSIGLLLEADGNDRYESPRGQGAAIVLYEPGRGDEATVRMATGALLDAAGHDVHECGIPCLGNGLRGTRKSVEVVEPDERGDLELVDPDRSDNARGVLVVTGLFADLGGRDAYPDHRGARNDHVRDDDSRRTPGASSDPLGQAPYVSAYVHVNESVFLDLPVADSDGDLVVDPIERSLGYDDADADRNPYADLLAGLNVQELVEGEDRDGDCWSDALEKRLGTDPNDRASRPTARLDCPAPGNGMLLLLSIDLTLGTGPTAEERRMEVPIANERPLGGGLATDGIALPLLAVGDVTDTDWERAYLVAIDLGGDDVYSAAVGTARPVLEDTNIEAVLPSHMQVMPGLAIDVAGDDRYEGPTGEAAFGVGISGTFGVLAELAGHDISEVAEGLGAGLGPGSVGVLVDLSGDDTREADRLFAFGHAAPSCAAADQELCARQDSDDSDLGTPTVGMLVDALGRDSTRSRGQGTLSIADDQGNVDASFDSARTAQDLAAYVDLGGADRYVLTALKTVEDAITAQGYAHDQGPRAAGATSLGGENSAGRVRGAAVFVDAGGRDEYGVLLQNGTLVDISKEKNDRVVNWGVAGRPGGDSSPAFFADGELNPADLLVAGPQALIGVHEVLRRDEQGGSTGWHLLDLPRLGVHVGGPLSDTYTRSGAFVVDLGGDDWYLAPVGGALGHTWDQDRPALDVALALDVSGNDTYLTRSAEDRATEGEVTGPFAVGVPIPRLIGSQGGGALGVGVLIDGGGTNRFIGSVEVPSSSTRPAMGIAQGAAYLGVGVLSLSGTRNSVYASLNGTHPESAQVPALAGIAQGSGVFGVGLLVSSHSTSSDEYTVVIRPTDREVALAQGAARGWAADAGGSFGALVDSGGDNRFRITGGGQGAAGPHATGVLASLGDGADSYTALGCAQGATPLSSGGTGGGCDSDSWLLSTAPPGPTLGLLVDQGGDDVYQLKGRPQRAPRGQGYGFAGTGLLLDLHGNDVYRADAQTPDGASYAQGSAMARLRSTSNLGALADRSGDDQYFAGGLAQGAALGAAQGPALGILLDMRGDDHYRGRSTPAGGSQGFGTASGQPPSVGVLADFGGRDDFGDDPGLESVAPAIAFRQQVSGTGRGLLLDADVLDRVDAVLSVVFAAMPASELATALRVLDPGCQGRLPGDGTIRGLACIVVHVNGTGPAPSPVVEEITFWIDPREESDLGENTTSEYIGRLDGHAGQTRYDFSWDSRQGFRDGNRTLRASILLAPTSPDVRKAQEPEDAADIGSLMGTGARLAPQAVGVVHVTRMIRLDGPPDVRIFLPSSANSTPTAPNSTVWFNPWLGPFNVTVEVHGESSPPTLVTAELVQCNLGGCVRRPLQTPPVPSSREDETIFRSNVSIGALDGAGSPIPPGFYALNVSVADDSGRFGFGDVSVGIDLLVPRGIIDVSPLQNANTTRGGGFMVEWQALDDLGEVESVALYAQAGDNPEAPWINDAPFAGNSSWGRFLDGQEIKFRMQVVDKAGNVAPTAATAITTVDLTPPILSDPRVDHQFVRSGESVKFSINVTEPHGLGDSFVIVDGRSYPLQSAGFTDKGGATRTQLVYGGWGGVSRGLALAHGTNASRPQGYAFQFAVADQAKNLATSAERAIFIDDIAPIVTAASVAYPRGDAAGPGDLVRFVVGAADNFGIQGVSANVTSLSSATEVVLFPVPGTGNFTGGFIVDRALTPPIANVTITVRDLAGNEVNATVPVAVETRAPSIASLRLLDVGATYATLAWTTELPSGGSVLLVNERTGRELRVAVNGTATDHRLEFADLSPSTRYQGTLVPTNLAGRAAEGRTFEFVTGSLIGIEVLSPNADQRVAGLLTVSWNATSPHTGPLSYGVSVVDENGAVPLASIVGPPSVPHAVKLPTRGLPDGVYTVVVRADHPADRTEARVANVLIDNTPPTVRLLSPAPGGVTGMGDTRVVAFVLDAGSGVDPAQISMLVDGIHHPVEGGGDGTFFADVALGAPGLHAVVVTASDRTGNTASDGGPVIVDPDAPNAGKVLLGGRPGATIVRPGTDVPIAVAVDGTSRLVARVNASSLGVTELIPLAFHDGALVGNVGVPPDAAEGAYVLDILLKNAAGGVQNLAVSLGVDRTAPTFRHLDVEPLDARLARVHFEANEPVSVRLTAEADDGSVASNSSARPMPFGSLDLGPLRPGGRYVVTVELEDIAGNPFSLDWPLSVPRDDIAPGPPARPRAEHAPTGDVALSWSPAWDDVGVASYRVLRSEAGGTPMRVGETPDVRFVDATARPGVEYLYTVVAVDHAGNEGGPSEVVPAVATMPPRMVGSRVTPDVGTTLDTFRFETTYIGPEDPSPRVDVIIDGVAHPMVHESGASCLEGCRFSFETTLTAANLRTGGHSFSFRAQAAGFLVRDPLDGHPLRGPVVVVANNEDVSTGTAVAAVLLGATSLVIVGVGAWRRWGRGGAP